MWGKGIGQLFLFAYGGWFFWLCARAWFWVLFGLLVLGSTATKVVGPGSGFGSLLGFFVVYLCCLLVLSACDVFL